MSNFITKKLALLCCIFFATAFIAEAQGLEAVNDIIRTGPLQTVRKDIIYNDIIPGDSYSWKITTTLPVSQGTITKNGDNIIFTPNAGIRDTDFFIEYELSGSGTTSVATVHIFITNYNMPVNIIDSDVECFSYMDENITFGIRHKYSTSPTGINSYVDGYQLPLVGDLNGDGKPEIVAMGATGGGATPGGSYDIATGYINIYDGQTGVRLVRYDYDPDMNLTGYHRPPAMLALADLDSDGLGEIVMCNSANGRVTAYKPVINSAGVITNLSEMWTARDQNNAIVNYKAPLPAAHNNFQHAMPNIADLDADGIPEVIVYNKIFQGTTGRLVMSWQGQNSTTSSLAGGLSDYSNAASLSTSAIANNYRNAAMVGKRLGSYAYTRFIPIPAITDIDGDGMQEIITGSYIYNFNITDKSNHTNNSYSISHGPLTATVHENNSNNNATVTYNFSDGFTRVADIDGDGSLDIIVLVFGDSGSADTKGVIYVWNTNDLDNVKACISFRGNGGTGANFSVPFIGDINGELDGYDGSGWTRKLPEICLVTGDVYINRSTANEGRTGVKFHPLTDENIRRGTASGSGTAAGWDNNQTGNTNRRFNRDVSGGKGHIIGLTWDASATVIEDRLKLSWGMEHDDDSGNTGITLFDFDNNNTADLCYRDEKTLRVISPAINGGKDYVELSETEATPGSSIMFRTNCATGTGYEAPVIADVNMDGSADIVVTNASSSAASRAWIDVFEYNGHKWSPCPPVWNQGMYDPTQVREDLKINAQPTPILTPYVKNGETIYPYNGSWMQRPIVRDDDDYVPVVRKPDAILMDMDVQVSSSTTITLDIYNKGTATIAASALIHFYNGGGTGSGLDLQNSPLITTQQVGVDIFPNERKILTYTLTANYNNTLIWATILMNNQGVLDAGYDDCDISNNSLGGAHCPQHIYTVTASPDTVICGNDNVVLTATPQFSANTPVYQWYRNDVKITGATSQTYTATLSGTYKCYVIDGICRDFSSPKTITRDTPVAVDDHVSTTSGVTVKVNVLHNDTKSEYCNPMPVITKYPNHASSSVDADGRIIYTSVAGYTGTDTLTYSIAGSEAKVYFKISNLPDNVIEADCEATPPATVWSIKEIPINTEAKLHNYGPLTVGDIDDDGTVEIIGFIEDGSSYAHDYTSTGIKIFYFDKDEQKVKLKKQFKFSNEHDITATFGGMAIARYNNQGYIVVAGIDYYLYAYSPDGSLHWKSDYQYHSLNNHYGTIVSIADFDGNGTPEVYTGNSIFSIANGHRICDGGASGNRGQLYKYSGSMSFAANIVGDNKLELCAGDTIYDVNLTNHTMTPVKSLTSALPTGAYHDGATMVADINNDGQLDVIVVSKVPDAGGHGQDNKTVVYVWTPDVAGTGGSLIGSFATPNSEYYGIPMIGNIDDTSYPEIVFVGTIGHIYALKYDPTGAAGNRIVKKWEFAIVDPSAATGMSLFDFNLDGQNEIVYRDPGELRIIDGNYSATTTLPATQVKATFTNVLSGTLRDFPVVADIDSDGQAEIVVTGDNSVPNAQNGYLRVFKSNGSPWAPARKVWNQYAYNAVNVHENLTIPTEQFNIASVFPGPDISPSTSDDLRPFNSFMQQQTLIDTLGVPVMLTPDALFVESVAFNYVAKGDSLLIALHVKNNGDADLQAPFYISTYNGTTNMSVDSSMVAVYTGATKSATVTIRNFSTYLPMTDITIVVNNKGAGVNAFLQPECNFSNNDTVLLYTSLLLAHNDSASTITTTPVMIDAFDNDSIPAGCTPTFSMSAKHGSATTVNDSIRYVANSGFVGYDTITYTVSCNSKTSTAKVYILVYNKPDNIIEQEDCYEPTESFEFKIKEQWNSADAHHMTGVLVGDMNGDGLPEIIAYNSILNKIYVRNGQNGNILDTITLDATIAASNGWYPAMTAALVDADRDGKGEIIFIQPGAKKVVSYKVKTVNPLKLEENWTSAVTFDNPTGDIDPYPQPIVADFNGDGIAEVVVYNKIYNAATGAYLGYTELTVNDAHVGRIINRGGNKTTNFMTTADFDGDGLPEIAAGGKVYKVNFNSDKTQVTCEKWSELSTVVDGFTAVADVDMDGLLDMVVVNMSGSLTQIQVWTPKKGTGILIYTFTIPNSDNCQSYPFVGDIDGYVINGKKYPEICVVTRRTDLSYQGRVTAYKFDPVTRQYSQKWEFLNSDTSGGTGITLFDFNNDGINELCYRDENHLRVLNGQADATPVLADAGAIFSCTSGTSFEYPVIADTDGDGSANICITCGSSVHVYESGSKPWAPTRKVWNQVNYEPLQINENLTVPQFSIPKNTAFAGKYPYNGALIQVPTMVNEEFTIVQLAADPAVDDIWIEEVDALNSKLCVRIKNLGVKNTNPTLPVAFYKGGIALSTPAGGANQSKPVGVVIQPGDTYTVCSDNILVAELQPQMSVRIQDDGVKFLADGSYLDCDSTNNIGTVNSLLAIRDYVISVADKPVDFNVLDNDYFGSCDRSTLSAFDTIANSGLKHGSLIINNSDGDYTYTPAAGFMGIDSLTYYIKCGVDSSAAKVYILIHKPLSQQYVACHEASITMGFTPVSGISYYWYASETGGTPIATGNPSNTLTVTKNNSAIETWWVEARHGNIAFSRYRINLLLGDCGITDPTGCAIDGTVIFKEDFGGNDNTTSNVSPTGIGSRSEYAYTSNLSDHNGGDDIYTISKYVTSVNPAWHDIFDHTSLDEEELGYCMFVNGKTKKKAYELEINDLCPNTLLYFSIWVTNIVKSGQGLDKPYLELVLYDKSTGDTISIYRTGATMNEETSLTWKMYGFPFTTPSDMTDLVFIIYSDGDGSGGNDYAIDDIEVRFCAPKVNTNIIANDTLICAGTDLDIIGTYIEDCTFGDEVAYRWEFRHIDSVAWKPLQEDNEEVMLDCNATDPEERTIESTWSIYSANENNVGYYRMLVSSPINIDNAVCRAASDSILVRMIPTTKAADIRIDVCPLPVRQIHLTKFIDTLKYTTVDWEKVSSAGPDVLDPHAGTINTQGVNSTYKYKYLLMSECGTSAAVAYVHSLKDRLQRKIAPIFICKEQETSAYVNINRILGLELGIEVSGVTWTYPVNPDNVVTKNLISIPTSSPYSGAIVFNARAAWEDAVISGNTAYDAGYAADPNAKKFVFRYTVSGSCIGAVTKDIIIIVTEKMF